MKKALLLKPMLLLFALIVGSSSVWAADVTITIGKNPTNLPTDGQVSYNTTEQQFTVGNVTFKMNNYNPKSGQIRGNQGSNSSVSSSNFYLYNTTAIPGTLKSISITVTGGSIVDSYTFLNTGTSAITSATTSGTNPSNASWSNLSGTYFCIGMARGGTSGTTTISSITITYTPTASDTPSISAEDVNIAYNATSGSIDYTIDKPVTGATISASTTADWITNFSYSTSSSTAGEVTFSTTVNESSAKREGTVTLKYMNGNEELASKNVKVIQAKHPFVITDGYFDFTQGEDYGSELETSSVKVQTSTWTAVNVTMYMAGRNCWFENTNTTPSQTEIRLYKADGNQAAGSITLSVPTGYVITNIVFTGKSLGNISANVGEYENSYWEGSSNSVTFTASDRTDIYSITVSYGRVITPAKAVTTYVTTDKLDFEDVEGGLEAFVATAAANGVVTLAKVGAVPAGTPLLLRGTASTDYTVPVVASATAPTTNLLRAGDGQTTIGGDGVYDYILSNGLWYHASAGTVAIGKAYLHCESDPTTTTGGAPSLSMDWGEGTTGIVNVNRETINDNQYYTLDGRRVAEPTRGIYILNGKKVIVK